MLSGDMKLLPVPASLATPVLLLFVSSALLAGCSGNAAVKGTLPGGGPVAPTLTWPMPAGITTATPLSATQLNATASTLGTFSYSPAPGTLLPAGTQTLTVTFKPIDPVDYTTVTATTTIAVTAGTSSYTWQNAAIVAGGFITGIVAHPTQKDLRYVRTDIGGAYRWNPTTSQWVPLLDFLTYAQDNDLGVESIALDPTNPQNLYLACGTYAAESFAGNGAMLISTNQGATFTIVPVPFKIGSNDSGRYAGERLAVDPNLPTTLYFGSRLKGLWKSTNSGAAWSQVTTFPVTATTSGVGVVFVDFVKASGGSGSATPLIYVGVSDAGPTYSSLYRSADGGATWAAVPNAPTGLYVTHGVFGPDGNFYASYGNAVGPTGVTAGALWKYAPPPTTTPTGAGTWTNISVPAPARPANSQGGYAAIAIDPETPGVLMASTIDDYYPTGDDIFRSTNGGATWVSFNAQGATRNYTLSPWLTFHNGTTVGTGNWPGTLVIDPFNSNHFLYGTGQTLWDSANVQVSDAGTGPAFTVGAAGIEETSVIALKSPPSGANLLSGVGDIGGFVHTTLTASPSQGMAGPPVISASGLDFAQALPATIVRMGGAAISVATDGGATTTSWNTGTLPTGSTAGGGTVALSADGTTIVWDTSDGVVAYSTNKAVAWTASTGALANGKVYSDRINAKKFYLLSGTSLQISIDGGKTFTNTSATLPANGSLALSYAAEGDVWFASGANFLHSVDSGTTFSAVTGLTTVSTLGFGAAASGAAYPAIYAVATGPGGSGFYRSTDEGATWLYLNDATHQFAYTPVITGDPRVYGRVYVGTNGRGILYGDSPN
jgi:hypothetical protein